MNFTEGLLIHKAYFTFLIFIDW